MISKEKKKIKIIFIITIMILSLIIVCILNNLEKETYAYGEIQEDEVKISNAEKVDLDEIIKQNSTSSGYTEKVVVEEEELEYITKYQDNPELYIGKTEVSQEGRNGTQAITIKEIYDEKGELVERKQVSAIVVKSSINKIIDIGTKKYVAPEKKETKSSNSGLSFNIALNKPSGFTLEQFKTALTDSKDTNKIFQDNAEYFYYIEEQYNINGLFVAAVGIHESAWGNSKLAINKKNLFGYGAYDSNPYNGAYSFESYAESIDLIARVFVKYYINKPGTSIYDGQEAKGSYYSGSTLSDVNKRYASDTNWSKSVYAHMQYLYNKIS